MNRARSIAWRTPLFFLLLLASLIFALFDASMPMRGHLPSLCAATICLIGAIICEVRCVDASESGPDTRCGNTGCYSRYKYTKSFAIIAFVLFSAILYGSDVSLYLRFQASKAHFESFVRNVVANDMREKESLWMGLYFVEGAELQENGNVLFPISMGPMLYDQCGFEWRPTDRPSGSVIEKRVAPHWYTYEE